MDYICIHLGEKILVLNFIGITHEFLISNPEKLVIIRSKSHDHKWHDLKDTTRKLSELVSDPFLLQVLDKFWSILECRVR